MIRFKKSRAAKTFSTYSEVPTGAWVNEDGNYLLVVDKAGEGHTAVVIVEAGFIYANEEVSLDQGGWYEAIITVERANES